MTAVAPLTREQARVAELLTLNAMVVGVIAGENVTRGQLAQAFDAVQNRDNWKMPVDAILDNAEMLRVGGPAIVREAVKFFAGCVPTIERLDENRMRVTARGYYAAVGA